jgi:hypothetical protein
MAVSIFRPLRNKRLFAALRPCEAAFAACVFGCEGPAGFAPYNHDFLAAWAFEFAVPEYGLFAAA